MADVATSAVERTFDIVELTEIILSYLNFRDLLHRAASVSKLWRRIIAMAGSKNLRQSLFLDTACPRYAVRWIKVAEDWWPRYNSLSRDPHDRVLYDYRLNPYLGTFTRPDEERAIAVRALSQEFYTEIQFQWHWLLSLPPGNWEQMFATQPPCTSLSLLDLRSQARLPLNDIEVHGNGSGVRLGQIAEAFRKEMRSKWFELEQLGSGARRVQIMSGHAVSKYMSSKCKVHFKVTPSAEELVDSLVESQLPREAAEVKLSLRDGWTVVHANIRAAGRSAASMEETEAML